jgi:hypothetical protein
MSRDNSKIDQFVKDSFDQLDLKAPQESWNYIADQIQPKRKSAFLLVIPWAAAVSILLAASFIWINFNKFQFDSQLGFSDPHEYIYSGKNVIDKHDVFLFNNSVDNAMQSSHKQQIVDNEQDISVTDIPPYGSEDKNKAKLAEVVSPELVSDEPHTESQSDIVKVETETKVEETDEIEEINKGTEQSDTQNKNEQLAEVKIQQEITSLPDPIVIHEKKNKWEWGVAGSFSPLYSYRNTNEGESDPYYNWGGGDENQSKEQPFVAYSGGFNFEYGNDRWSFSSGVYYMEQGQTIENLNFNKIASGPLTNVIYASTSVANIRWDQNGYEVRGDIGGSKNDGTTVLSSTSFESEIMVTQSFEFLEVPLIAKYKLIDKKVDLQVLGGLSTSFMIDNVVHMEYYDDVYDLGNTENLNKVNYNSIVGLGVQVPFTKRLQLQLQPTFRYAIKPYNRDYSIDYYPYSFAVYSGILFQF